MDVHVGVWDLMKLGVKMVQHRIQQYQLSTGETQVLTTNGGQVKGAKRKTLYEEQLYYAFEGIPYAQPPLGELRFRAPQPPAPWTGVRDCTSSWRKPLQKHFIIGHIDGNEDCLYLNVYAKKLKTEKPLPVMVWLYGGGFHIGEATRDFYSPDYFMMEEVVLVTLNYRLGALGFLSLQDRDLGVPGNAGLKDQLMALQWVKQNIVNFNGDPTNITLFGESAGAASTHLLMLSEKARGLFHKAILMSGNALCPWTQVPARDWGYRLACTMGYKGANNDKAVFRFLSSKPGKSIASADLNLITREEMDKEFLIIAMGPVVEPYEDEDSLITKPFVELLKDCWSNSIPVLIGGTSAEGLFSYEPTKMRPGVLNELGDCETVLPNEVQKGLTAAELKQMGQTLRRAHFGDKKPHYDETLYEYLDLLGFKNFWHGIHRTTRARLAYAAHAPTYLYRFDFDSPFFNHFRVLKCGKQVRGTCHADDLSYLFNNLPADKLPTDSPEYHTIRRLVGMWTAFATSSNPNCAHIRPAVWEPLEAENPEEPLKCLNIGKSIASIGLPGSEKFKAWDGLYDRQKLY